jgi:hypothetical protein
MMGSVREFLWAVWVGVYLVRGGGLPTFLGRVHAPW